MAIEPAQLEFLRRLNKKAVDRVSQNNQQALRDTVLENLQNQIGERVGELRDRMDLQVENQKGKTQQVLNYDVRDQETEFDIDEQFYEGYRLVEEDDETIDPDGKNFLKHLEAGRMVTDMSRDLEVEIDVEVPDLDTDGNPQFNTDGTLKTKVEKKKLFEGDDLKKALGAELYQPLVREGLMPETFVPDDFSETREMLDGSFAAYKERLEKEGLNNKIFSPENIAMAKTVFGSTVSIIGSSGAISDTQSMTGKDSDPSKLAPSVSFFTDDLNKDRKMAAIADMTNLTFGVLMLGNDALGEIGGGEEVSSDAPMRKIAVAITNYVGIALASSIQGGNIPPSLPVALSTLFNGKCDNSKIALGLTEALEEGGDAGVTKAATAIGQGMDKAFDDAGLTNDKVAHACAGGMGSIPAASIAANLREQAYDRVLDAFQEHAKSVLAPIKGPADTYLLTHGAALNEALNEKITKDLESNLKADEEESKRELAAIENETDLEKRASLIEKKILELERSMKAIEWSVKLSKMAFDVASKFIGPLAIGGSLIKLMENTAKATSRACDAAQFLDSKQDMLRAASPYSSAVSNFVHNSRVQAAHYSVNAALDGLNMAGAIVETLGYASGPGALAGVVAGKIMQASANIGQAIEAVLYEIAKRVDLEKAWYFYRQALSRPENRKMGLKALRNNPTLAKYATAWGAVVKQDVLVSDFIQKTGLTAESLRDPKAEVGQVVKYLELRLPDDNVVVGRAGSPDWEPKKTELTVACFIGGKTNAVKKAKLKDDPTRDIEMALANYEKEGVAIYTQLAEIKEKSPAKAKEGEQLDAGGVCWHNGAVWENTSSAAITLPVGLDLDAAADIAIKVSADNVTKLTGLCSRLSITLMTYSPVNSKGDPHIDFKNFLGNLSNLVHAVQEASRPVT